MNILHLLSQNHLTGAEVYACELIESQINNKHHVVQVSNGFYHPTKATKITLPVETKSSQEFKSSVQQLRKIIQDHNIHVVHTHSRAAAKLAHCALFNFWGKRLFPVGLVSTIHGRQHPSLSKKIKNIYGDYQIAICENVYSQLTQEFKYNSEHIKIIRNAISSHSFFPKKINPIKNLTEISKNETFKIAIIGRSTGPKKTRTQNFIAGFSELLQKLSIRFEIHLVGTSESDLTGLANQQNIFYHPHQTLNASIYSQFDLVVGSGRVCMESLMSGVPSIAFGEATYLGLCQTNNFKDFLKTNFGDIAESSFGNPEFSSAQAEQDLKNYFNLNVAQLLDLAKIAKNEFSHTNVSEKIQKIYECSYLKANHPHWIPVLMYHKIPSVPLNSPHKIFVTKDNFVHHLEYFKSAGFKTITFSELLSFMRGARPFSEFPDKPLILTFDDGYVDNFENANPLLKKYNFRAQLFLLADKQISYNYWDEQNPEKADLILAGEDRQKWKTSAFEVGSHGFKHLRLPQMNSDEALIELVESKKSLEKEFDTPICVYAYTYGDTNQDCALLAQKAGYDFAVNTDSGALHIADNPYQIFRVNIFPNDTTSNLKKKTSKWYRKYYYFKRKK